MENNNLTNPIIDANGTKYWVNEAGKFHRENGLPARETIFGIKSWWTNGVCYRSDVWIESDYEWINAL